MVSSYPKIPLRFLLPEKQSKSEYPSEISYKRTKVGKNVVNMLSFFMHFVRDLNFTIGQCNQPVIRQLHFPTWL